MNEFRYRAIGFKTLDTGAPMVTIVEEEVRPNGNVCWVRRRQVSADKARELMTQIQHALEEAYLS